MQRPTAKIKSGVRLNSDAVGTANGGRDGTVIFDLAFYPSPPLFPSPEFETKEEEEEEDEGWRMRGRRRT